MSRLNSHRQAFLGLRQMLQKRDPLGLMERLGGDKFDEQLYGFEATTMLEQLGARPKAGDVANWLHEQGRSRKLNVKEDAVTATAREVGKLLELSNRAAARRTP